eukprot:3960072-Pyramimonas_sp.AAC.1
MLASVKRNGAAWFSPQCSTWLDACRFNSKRDRHDVFGNISRTDVLEANHIANLMWGGGK